MKQDGSYDFKKIIIRVLCSLKEMSRMIIDVKISK